MPNPRKDWGAAFFLGKGGLTKDEVEAVKWFRKAAEQNLADAQYNLGVCYAKGEGNTPCFEFLFRSRYLLMCDHLTNR